MTPREKLAAALVDARANRDQAAAARTKAGTEWRNPQEDPTATYPKVRSAWALADAEWNMANALMEKLTAQLKELERTESIAQQRAVLEGAFVKARTQHEKANAALAEAARARADRDDSVSSTPAQANRRENKTDRRKPASDRRKTAGDRRNAQTSAPQAATAPKPWTETVADYNKAEADLNRARAALVEFNRTNAKK